MRCQLWRIAFPVVALFLALPFSQAQTATYHLHKEASTINTAFDQLKTVGPDASATVLTKALTNQPAGDYVIKEFETQTGVPNAPGIIPGGSTMSFRLFMRKTASPSGVTVKPEAKLRLNSATGTSLCSVIGSTALTTTVTKMTFTCTTPTGTGITMTASDRFYLWVGVNISAKSTSTYSGELDIEGTLNGNFDSTITAKVPSAGLTPTSLSFANQIVNTTSAARAVTLKNNQTTALTISSVTISGDYAQTNNCGTSLAAGASCTINVTFRPTAAGTRTGTLTVTDNGNDSPQTASLSGTGIALSSISVTPANPSVAKGNTQQFTATGTYTDNSTQNLTSTVTWSSSQSTVATINSVGLASTLAQGTSTITATSGSINGSTTLTVTAPALVSIAVTPANPSVPKGNTQQFTATGTYTDSSQQNLTSTVTWNSSNTVVATINTTGLASTPGQGTSTITATFGSINGSTTLTVTAPALVSIAVTPANPSVPKGNTQQFTATGTYTDNSTQNLTSTVTWNSSNTGVTTINTAGLASTPGQGTSTITATSGSVSGSTTLTVAPTTIVSIAVTPANPSVPKGSTQQFTATGTYADNSTQDITNTATWSSSATSVVTINSAGLASTLAQGSSTITATSGSVSGATTLTVTAPVLSSIAVTPANPSVTKGLTQQFTATGTYTDGSQQVFTNVTWASSATNIATINTTGLASTLAQGASTITATSGSVSGSTTMTVTAPALVTLAVPPANVSVPNGSTQQFTATGTYTDASTQNLTSSVAWTSSSTAVATINSAGLATASSLGTSTITASSGSINATGTLNVVTPTSGPFISSLSVSQATVGSTITITGSNFGSSQGYSVVTFNGISAGLCSPAASCWANSSILINVPAGATSGNVVVNVNGMSSNGVSLTVVPPPVITGLTPMWIPVGGAMTIQGSGFGSSGTVTISNGFGTATAVINSWSSNSISVTVPASLPAGSNTQVVVNTNGIASQPFSFTAHAAPALDTFSGIGVCLANGVPPDVACVTQGAMGARVYITGTNLGQFQGDSTVTFGGVPATQLQQGGSRFVTATIPSGITPAPNPTTTVNVTVTVDGVSSNAAPFTVTASPVISSLSATTGGEGTQVTISGSNFGSTGTVAFNGTVATVQSGNWSSGQIITTVPTGASSGSVVVSANGVSSNGINFNVPPSIASPLNPTSGPAGTSVVITGAGFGSPQGSSTATFNGTTATITSWSPNSITALVPSIAAGASTVSVTVAGQSATASFTVTAGPSITSLSSISGTTGSLVGINGSAFGSLQGANVVRFNGAAAQVCTANCVVSGCAVNGWSNSCIPAYVPSNATTGPVTVTVATATATGPQYTVTGAGTGQISGTVTCSSGTVTIQALRQGTVQGSATTPCNGSYSIANLAADSYDVQASATGLGTATQNAIPVTVGGNTSGINFNLSTAATITGQITQANGGAAINGATVQVFVGSAVASSVNTGSGNTYSFSNLNAATYRVQVSAPGYIDQSQNVTVAAGSTATQNFALQAPGNTPITYSYDNIGRLIGVTDQSGDTANYNYDAVGNITSITRHSSAQVSLISIAPSSAQVGDTVTLTGTGFSSTASQNTVQFAGSSAVATTSSATQITITVPSGAATGQVSVNANGTTSNSIPFTVLTSGGAPTITNLNPSIGVAGTSFIVTGTNFDAVMSNDQLGLNSTALLIDPTTYNSTNIGTSVPAMATSGHVSLTTRGGTATSSQDFFVVPPGHGTGDVAYTARIPFPSSGQVSLGTVPVNQIAMVLFDAVGGQKANIVVNSTSFNFCGLLVYAPNNSTPIYNRFGSPNCATAGFSTGGLLLPATGTYTIVFNNGGSVNGTLNFTLLNATDFASPIAFGQTLTVPITTAGQTGRLTFFAQANQHISVNVVAGLGSACNLSLVGPANQSLQFAEAVGPLHFSSTGNCSTTNNFWDVGYLPSLTGVYTIVVDPQGATGSVQLQLLDSTDTVTPASLTTSGSTVSVSNTVAGQNNQVVFSGTAGQKISLLINSMSGYVVNSQGVNVYVQMIGPDGTWLTSLLPSNPIYAGRFFDPRSANQILPATGNYTILVDPAGFNTSPGSNPAGSATGSTSLTLYLSSDVTASTLDATGLPLGGSVSTSPTPTAGQGAAGQTITFPFTANFGQSLAFELDETTSPQVGCMFTLYDPNHQPLTSTLSQVSYQNLPCNSTGVLSDLTDPLPATGTYTLVLQPAINTATPYNTGSYKLTLTNTQDNVYTITPTSGGTQLTVSNTVPRQNDVVTFQGTAGQTISLVINSANYNPGPRNSFIPNLVISGPAGPSSQQLASICCGSFQAGGSIAPFTLPATGTYTIFITPGGVTGDAVGTMTFTLTSQ